jgi:hypothetical protein
MGVGKLACSVCRRISILGGLATSPPSVPIDFKESFRCKTDAKSSSEEDSPASLLTINVKLLAPETALAPLTLSSSGSLSDEEEEGSNNKLSEERESQNSPTGLRSTGLGRAGTESSLAEEIPSPTFPLLKSPIEVSFIFSVGFHCEIDAAVPSKPKDSDPEVGPKHRVPNAPGPRLAVPSSRSHSNEACPRRRIVELGMPGFVMRSDLILENRAEPDNQV